jgi:hypothetical protein
MEKIRFKTIHIIDCLGAIPEEITDQDKRQIALSENQDRELSNQLATKEYLERILSQLNQAKLHILVLIGTKGEVYTAEALIKSNNQSPLNNNMQNIAGEAGKFGTADKIKKLSIFLKNHQSKTEVYLHTDQYFNQIYKLFLNIYLILHLQNPIKIIISTRDVKNPEIPNLNKIKIKTFLKLSGLNNLINF